MEGRQEGKREMGWGGEGRLVCGLICNFLTSFHLLNKCVQGACCVSRAAVGAVDVAVHRHNSLPPWSSRAEGRCSE